jgi:hypothetical protein
MPGGKCDRGIVKEKQISQKAVATTWGQMMVVWTTMKAVERVKMIRF